MEVTTVPEPIYELTYNNKAITVDIAPFVISIGYTDHLSGEADELDIEVEDVDGRWLNAWYPEKGAVLTLAFGYKGQVLIKAGAFCVDEIEFADTPSTVRIRGTATGVMHGVRTRQARSWEHTTLAAIVTRIAKHHQMKVIGKIEAFAIDRATQYHESDLTFLERLAKQYGYVFKVTDNNKKMVFTKHSDLLAQSAKRKFNRADIKSWRGTDRITDAPGEVRNKYHDPKTKTLVVYGVVGDKSTVVGQTTAGRKHNADTQKMAVRAPTPAAAQAMTQAELDRRHLERTSVSLRLAGDPALAAGSVIELLDFGKLSGLYSIDRAQHHIKRSDGFTTEIECKRVAPPMKGKVVAATTGGLTVYGIKGGETSVVGTTPDPGKRKR